MLEPKVVVKRYKKRGKNSSAIIIISLDEIEDRNEKVSVYL
jgi:hypothetical protein